MEYKAEAQDKILENRKFKTEKFDESNDIVAESMVVNRDKKY
ncbi:hypothetical protein [Levilactobacillus brevis]|nr:hypothetical protein [Levilactobacillus brevis]